MPAEIVIRWPFSHIMSKSLQQAVPFALAWPRPSLEQIAKAPSAATLPILERRGQGLVPTWGSAMSCHALAWSVTSFNVNHILKHSSELPPPPPTPPGPGAVPLELNW